MSRCVAFDVDGTLLNETDGVRWEVVDLLRAFKACGWDIVVWSGGGKDYADMWVRRLGLTPFVFSVQAKRPMLRIDLAIDDMPDADFGPSCPVVVV